MNLQYKRIIPCLDVDDGRVVKGIKFKGLKDIGDPVELAKLYSDQGADEICFLDIGAVAKNRATLLDVVRKVADEISVPLCVAGGIRSVEDMRETVKAGASRVSVCSAALERPELLSEMAAAFGSQSVVLSIDAKKVCGTDRAGTLNDTTRWHAFTKGGRIDTGLDAIEWAIKAAELGAGEIAVNSIDTDGTGKGYDIELCSALVKAVSIPVAASSGAGNIEQIAEVFEKSGVSAAMIASILHYKKTTIPEIKNYLKSKGIYIK